MPQRFVYRQFVIDTNRIKAHQRLESMNRLERWRENGVILLIMTDVSQAEAMAGSNPGRSRKATRFIYAISSIGNPEFHEIERQVETILFPGGARNQNQRNDVRIVCAALAHQSPLITNDGVILRSPDRLRSLGAAVLSDGEAIAEVEECIATRDEYARRAQEETGERVPDWVGQD
jgi:hypothetical protein